MKTVFVAKLSLVASITLSCLAGVLCQKATDDAKGAPPSKGPGE